MNSASLTVTLDHDTLRQIVWDVGLADVALRSLQQLLIEAHQPEDDAKARYCLGLAMLLRGAEERVGLALDGLRAISSEAAVPGVPFAASAG